MLRPRRVELCANVALVAAFVLFVTFGGTPALRHDWMWPIDRAGFMSVLSASFSGWVSDGIGSASPRMVQSIVNVPIIIVGLIAGPMWALAFFSAAIAAVVTYGARRVCWALDAKSGIVRFGAMTLALFNPWTYDHIVAGHMAMILSFGASLTLLSFALGKSTARRREQLEAACFVALAMPQLQLFLLDSVLIAILAARRRMFLPAISYGLALVPTAVGILTSAPDLAATPFTQEWERVQSIPLKQSWALAGYFAAYDTQTPKWGFLSLQLALLLSVLSAFIAKPRATIAAAGATGLVLLIASGLQGPLAAPFVWLFTNFPPVRAFRELHDLLAFALCGYLLLLGLGARLRSLNVGIAALCCIYMISWVAMPPFYWWVDGRTIEPLQSSVVTPYSRFALFPAFQPLMYMRRGSGVDAQSISASRARSPLNEIVPLYPTSIALARYRRSGDTTLLKALSVSTIFERPKFESVAANFAPATRRRYPLRTIHLNDFVPLLSRCTQSSIVSAPSQIGSCNQLYSDAHTAMHAAAPISNVETSDPRKGWIDVRLVFARNPDLGQPFGGVYTENRSVVFRVAKRAALIRVEGTLQADNGEIHSPNGRLTWVLFRNAGTQLRCNGRCLVALEADEVPPANVPVAARVQRFEAEPLDQITPWWSEAKFPSGVIRYNVRYEPQWVAFDSCGALEHFRIDALVNGWYGRVQPCGETTILYWPAAVQCALAIIMALWFYTVFLVYVAITSRRTASNRSALCPQV